MPDLTDGAVVGDASEVAHGAPGSSPSAREAALIAPAARGRGATTFAAFGSVPFRFLWVNAFAFAFVQNTQRFTFAWHASDLGGAKMIGIVAFAMGIPVMVLTLVAGVLSDRVDRRRILVVSQSVSLVFSAVAAVAVWSGAAGVGVTVLLAACLGSAAAFVMPVQSSIVPSLFERDRLMNAVTLMSLTQNVSQLTGPALGGLTIAIWGVGGAFASQALLYALSLAALSRLGLRARAAMARRNPLRDIRDGFAFVAGRADMRTLFILLTITALITGGTFQALVPQIARDELGAGSLMTSGIFACMGAGTLVTSLVLASIGNLKNKGGWFMLTMVGGGSLMFFEGISRVYGLTCFLFFLNGLNAGVFMNLNQTLIQTNTPSAVMGRIMSIYALCFVGLTPIGALAAGFAADRFTAWGWFSGSGFVLAAIGVACLLSLPRLRQMD